MCPSLARVAKSIAPLYSPKNSYQKDDVVTLNGIRKVALQDIPADTPYDPAMWKDEDVQAAIEAGGGVSPEQLDEAIRRIVPEIYGNAEEQRFPVYDNADTMTY